MKIVNEEYSSMDVLGILTSIAGIASLLWQKGWAERNGGNLSVNITASAVDWCVLPQLQLSEFQLERPFILLAGDVIYLTGTGTRMRDVAQQPVEKGCFIKVGIDGRRCEVWAAPGISPSSELPSHFAIQEFLKSDLRGFTTVLHTHPTELIALTHNRLFLDGSFLTKILWSMIPETRIFIQKGVGVLPYAKPGSNALAALTLEALTNHDVVLWEKHGALSVGKDIADCFDNIDTLNKSAQIYIAARQAGFQPEGLSDSQMDELGRVYER